MDLINWTKDLETGIATIDQQHQKLVAILNQLNEACSKNKGRITYGMIMTKLVNYTVAHFKTEEDFFLLYDYPYRKAHIALHRQLIEKVDEFSRLILDTEEDVAADLLAFVHQWLIEHIKKDDMEYAPFLLKEGAS